MTNALPKGANAPLPTETLTISAVHKGANTDLSAIMLAATGKVRNDADFVFYGNPNSPDSSVVYKDKNHSGDTYSHSMTAALDKVPAEIEKIQITLTIDPDTPATFSAVKDLVISIKDAAGKEHATFSAEGTVENAFIVGELYRRNGAWKVRHVAQGFTGGLGSIATAFGLEVEDDPQAAAPVAAATPATPAAAATPAVPAAAPAPASRKISLSKVDKVTAELEGKGSRLVKLQKSAAISLKKNNLDNVVARVVMVLDASGSTQRMWPEIMQGVTDRLATLALNLDDNGELEFWVYATTCKKFATVTLKNLDGYIAALMRGEDGSGAPAPKAEKKGFWGRATSAVSSLGQGIVPGLGYDNNEPVIMEAIIKECKDSTTVPTLVLFVTDGGIDKDRAIEKLLVDSSRSPIFWQFIGLGGHSYGVLERFDTLTGRHVDNAGFFAIDDYRKLTDEDLYNRIVQEFPKWLSTVKSLGMIS